MCHFGCLSLFVCPSRARAQRLSKGLICQNPSRGKIYILDRQTNPRFRIVLEEYVGSSNKAIFIHVALKFKVHSGFLTTSNKLVRCPGESRSNRFSGLRINFQWYIKTSGATVRSVRPSRLHLKQQLYKAL